MVKNLPASAGDVRRWFYPWVGTTPREGGGSPLQRSCLENPLDRGAWRATVHGVTEGQTHLAAEQQRQQPGSLAPLVQASASLPRIPSFLAHLPASHHPQSGLASPQSPGSSV